jgi:hypothetical protein
VQQQGSSLVQRQPINNPAESPAPVHPADPVEARSIIFAAADFLNTHPSVFELFRRQITASKSSNQIRQFLSVPLFSDTVEQLFAGKRKSMFKSRRTRRLIRRDLDRSKRNLKQSERRAATELLRQLSIGVRRPGNQIFMLAFMRFLETDDGDILAGIVADMPEFQAAFDSYDSLLNERQAIALTKIKESHTPPSFASIEPEAPSEPDVAVEPDPIVVRPEPVQARPKPPVVEIVSDTKRNIEFHPQWMIPGQTGGRKEPT